MPALPIPAKAKIFIDSAHEDIDALTIERTSDGTMTGVSLWPTTKERFSLIILPCTRAERDALRTSYRTNRALLAGTMTFSWPRPGDEAKTTRWVSPPSWRALGNDRYAVTCSLEEV